MKVCLKIPRFQPHPLGEQIYLQHVIKELLSTAPQDWEFVVQYSGLRGDAVQRELFAPLDPLGRSHLQHVPLPDSLLERTLKALNMPSARQLFGKADIVHNMRCQWIPRGIGCLVLTIQDVIPLRCNDDLSGDRMSRQMVEFIKFIEHDLKAVITISEFSKSEIVEALGIPPHLIAVIPDGVDHERFRPISPDVRGNANSRIHELGITQPYVAYIGGQGPRKNLPRLIRAFNRAKKLWDIDHQLVLAGSRNLAPEVRSEIENSEFRDQIVFTGYVSDSDLLTILQLSDFLLFASLYEGFGLPALEAMACGIPVAVSRSASLPEVCGDAAVYFDPESEEDICEAMYKLISDEQLQRQCAAKSVERAAMFSWKRNANATIELYKSLCPRA